MGLLQPACIWNKLTGNIVGGHQRISQLDNLYRKDNYEVTVCKVELSEKDEVKANIKLNNPNLQGKYNNDALNEIHLAFPELDFQKDFSFEKIDIDFMFPETSELFNDFNTNNDINPDIGQILKIKETRKKYRDKEKALSEDGLNEAIIRKDDYFVTIVFNTNTEKWNFMKKLGLKKELKYIKEEDLECIKIG